MNKNTILIGVAWLLGVLGAFCTEDLAADFRNPPESTKPYCYWYWLNGDIAKDGITKDLEAMAKVGIKRAMIGNIQEDPKKVGPVKMFTPEWTELTRHAMKEASRWPHRKRSCRHGRASVKAHMPEVVLNSCLLVCSAR